MKKQIRCAIYTRKSSEEGLEQDFNSLDAQREACEAYIKSQMHECWILIEKQYNDVFVCCLKFSKKKINLYYRNNELNILFVIFAGKKI